MFNVLYPALFVFLMIVLMLSWWPRYGLWGAVFAALSRGLWLLPLLALLLPPSAVEAPLVSLGKPEVAVFIDDSLSMKQAPGTMQRPKLSEAEMHIEKLQEFCRQQSCDLKVTYGSQLSDGFLQQLSPLHQVIPQWLQSWGKGRPWLIFSDGGATAPQRLIQNLQDLPWEQPKKLPAFVVGWWDEEERNIFLSDLKWDGFGFTEQPFRVKFRLRRSEISSLSRSLQLQVSVDDSEVLVRNITFDDHSQDMDVELIIPPLQQGSHGATITVLPLPGERELWDNHLSFNVDILAHTIGVLHLQGSPHADGRFLRRFLKNDPRFEVMSFFILRDPWDRSSAGERELSLIPFPVDQIFREELPHFKAVVMQNFRLSEFVTPQQQNLLVDYVKQGGSLLFLGGPRAFHFTDLQYTPLRQMLPFDIAPNAATQSGPALHELFASSSSADQPQSGLPWYQSDLSFTPEAAPLPTSARSLPATALHRGLGEVLAELKKAAVSFQGLHHMEEVTWHKKGWLPVWQARVSPQLAWPLISASYVGSGRVIWVFSDALWQIAMASGEMLSRDVHHRLFYEMFRWLSRDEKNPPLSLNTLSAYPSDAHTIKWSAQLWGSGVDFLLSEEGSEHLSITLCQQEVQHYKQQRLSKFAVSVEGQITLPHKTPQRCTWTLEVSHGEMGKEVLRSTVAFYERYTDRSFTSSQSLLKAIEQHLGGHLIRGHEGSAMDEVKRSLLPYLESQGSTHHTTQRQPSSPYDVFQNENLLWLLLFMPLEVLIRRFFIRTPQPVSV